MEKENLLTGDRPTGKLHIGHYIGSLKKRVEIQDQFNNFIMIADQQALTDNAKNPKIIQNSLIEVILDYLSVGIDPIKSNIFVQSQIPELSELTIHYLNLVSISRLKRNPTVKNEMKEKNFGDSVPTGFFIYPVSQAADITAFKASIVPVGEDQIPMIEQTNEIVKTFNNTYKQNVLKRAKALLPEKGMGRLPGIDGKAKMSKSLNNAIYLSDSPDIIRQKVMSMYTDPNHIRVTDPGRIEDNTVFTYLDAFCKDKKYLAEMKKHYKAGGLGDVKVKKYLNEIIQAELEPIRNRRNQYKNNLDYIYEILKDGSNQARLIASQTLHEVRDAMGINYF
ncbi:tryptophan--tRNA ligase [Staphylococcus epidermidis]|uniref:tryptophan--tRNA ligase n=1 Tax=Staphylococcus epidermidis TaxID=1282 RepID=UPI000C166A31|nr:tryptophan--tRNA ligase [Staphylococcus epidermidis]ATQ51148.1 tryptophan--tRNA ligase [Staphylococcus epidermidis]MCG1389312.1 tryptophan--tRNA ligase [Staphylococcus epidermidis]MCG1416559.1 tryptophan--tRNA ligase [Staphylococcus epidermidis]MCG1576040.1 tryptophan--tRNA ligase [Staphylococcus epidermidis]MCG1712193.1 tryptophan--tRNA ligase [Staphylococcus epidermidis]